MFRQSIERMMAMQAWLDKKADFATEGFQFPEMTPELMAQQKQGLMVPRLPNGSVDFPSQQLQQALQIQNAAALAQSSYPQPTQLVQTSGPNGAQMEVPATPYAQELARNARGPRNRQLERAINKKQKQQAAQAAQVAAPQGGLMQSVADNLQASSPQRTFEGYHEEIGPDGKKYGVNTYSDGTRERNFIMSNPSAPTPQGSLMQSVSESAQAAPTYPQPTQLVQTSGPNGAQMEVPAKPYAEAFAKPQAMSAPSQGVGRVVGSAPYAQQAAGASAAEAAVAKRFPWGKAGLIGAGVAGLGAGAYGLMNRNQEKTAFLQLMDSVDTLEKYAFRMDETANSEQLAKLKAMQNNLPNLSREQKSTYFQAMADELSTKYDAKMEALDNATFELIKMRNRPVLANINDEFMNYYWYLQGQKLDTHREHADRVQDLRKSIYEPKGGFMQPPARMIDEVDLAMPAQSPMQVADDVAQAMPAQAPAAEAAVAKRFPWGKAGLIGAGAAGLGAGAYGLYKHHQQKKAFFDLAATYGEMDKYAFQMIDSLSPQQLEALMQQYDQLPAAQPTPQGGLMQSVADHVQAPVQMADDVAQAMPAQAPMQAADQAMPLLQRLRSLSLGQKIGLGAGAAGILGAGAYGATRFGAKGVSHEPAGFDQTAMNEEEMDEQIDPEVASAMLLGGGIGFGAGFGLSAPEKTKRYRKQMMESSMQKSVAPGTPLYRNLAERASAEKAYQPALSFYEQFSPAVANSIREDYAAHMKELAEQEKPLMQAAVKRARLAQMLGTAKGLGVASGIGLLAGIPAAGVASVAADPDGFVDQVKEDVNNDPRFSADGLVGAATGALAGGFVTPRLFPTIQPKSSARMIGAGMGGALGNLAGGVNYALRNQNEQ